ncbi:hypothetical protein F5Y03DRAFT_161516 [Xylaria venustula]|nr:hypothetical protein F5Y03DRAFT_161516 [Xylaria venustula]
MRAVPRMICTPGFCILVEGICHDFMIRRELSAQRQPSGIHSGIKVSAKATMNNYIIHLKAVFSSRHYHAASL